MQMQCGFCRSNGTLPLLLHTWATRRRGVRGVGEACSGPEAVRTLGCLYSRLGHLAGPRPLAPNPAHQQRPRRDGVGAVTTPRDGVGMAWGPSPLGTGGLPLPSWPSAAISRGRKKPAATASGATEDTSRRPRRALPRAGDGCAALGLVVSVTAPAAMGTAG